MPEKEELCLSEGHLCRIRSTKFVPRKMFCASHPGCQDATLSDTPSVWPFTAWHLGHVDTVEAAKHHYLLDSSPVRPGEKWS